MKHELTTLLEDGLLDEVLGPLKSGKEAEVFRVIYRGGEVAAKVYKERSQRSFQHNAAYKEGRAVRNTRTQRAIDKGSRFGRDESESEWKLAESRCLHTLHAAGVRVPVPVLFYEGVLLMELVLDAEGYPAPRLLEAGVTADRAAELYRDLRGQIIKMLCCDIVHGDLSPYNILLAAAGPTIIDFPQSFSAATNSQAERFFKRDYDTIHGFFARLDGRLWSCASDGNEVWRAWQRRELTPDFVPVPRPRPPQGPPRPQERPRPQGHPQGPRPQGPPPGPRPQGPPPGPRPPEAARGPFGGGGRPPPRAPAGPIVTYVRRPGERSPPPAVERERAQRPEAPAVEAKPDGNPHRRRKRGPRY